jgi:diadenosine tetraphosphate (Ap4A) HIT family hydrolase
MVLESPVTDAGPARTPLQVPPSGTCGPSRGNPHGDAHLPAASKDNAGVPGLTPVPSTVVEQGVLWTIAVNRNQNLLGKVMLVLRRPCTAVAHIEPDEWASLHTELRRLVDALTALYRPDQFNFAFLMNQDAQVHLHVLPRYAEPRYWNGRRFDDPHWGEAPGHEQRILQPGESAQLADEIRAHLSNEATS